MTPDQQKGAERLQRFLTNLRDVPVVSGLRKDEGWVDMRVQFLIDRATAGTDDMLLGWTVLPPGARHDRHLHRNADEFWIVLSGSGRMYTDDGTRASGEGDVVFTPRGHWHGFHNDSKDDVVLVWGWSGAGSLETSGYEVHEDVRAEAASGDGASGGE
jgi:mannose-6-phosphate isomerase-like protein (cupin superfamily)